MRLLSTILLTVCWASVASGQSLELGWPVDAVLNKDVILQMHVDHDLVQGQAMDYQCSPQYVYDGHRGTDITALNFRMMDEGVPVVAAADGVVSWIRDGNFDRNYWPPYQGEPNGIIIQHPDGSNSQYWHLRKHSIVVKPGDAIKRGQFIAYVGSSGQTPVPHLHFEVWTPQAGTGAMRVHDPFAGPCNPRAGLWEGTYPYPGEHPLQVYDMDIIAKTNLAGVEGNNYFGETTLKDRPFRPTVFGDSRTKLGAWTLVQGDAGTRYSVGVRRPNGEEFATAIKIIQVRTSGMMWHTFFWDWSTRVSEADHGTWKLELIYEGEVIKEVPFEVGPTTEYDPRFYPIAGRSIRLDGTEQPELLEVTSFGSDVRFDLIDAPSFVHLSGDTLIVDAGASMDFRSDFFSVSATDEMGRADTARFHLVDLDRPVRLVATERGSVINQSDLVVHEAAPNPFADDVKITFEVGAVSFVELTLYNVAGQIVRAHRPGFISPGTHQIRISSGDLAPGVYLYRLNAGCRNVTGSIVKVR